MDKPSSNVKAEKNTMDIKRDMLSKEPVGENLISEMLSGLGAKDIDAVEWLKKQGITVEEVSA